MRARALLIEALVGIISAAVAAGAFLWMASQWSLNSLQTLTRKVPVLLDHFQSDKERSASLGTFWLKSTR